MRDREGAEMHETGVRGWTRDPGGAGEQVSSEGDHGHLQEERPVHALRVSVGLTVVGVRAPGRRVGKMGEVVWRGQACSRGGGRGTVWAVARSEASWSDSDRDIFGGANVTHVRSSTFSSSHVKHTKKSQTKLNNVFYLIQYVPNIIISACI